MGSIKGKSNNPNGRPKGARNKRTVEWDKLGGFITEEGAKRVMKYLNSIEDDKEFFEKYERLLNYFKPRMQSTSLTGDISTEVSVKPKEWVK